jgi:hypothetical protein
MRAKYVALLVLCISAPLAAQRAQAPETAIRERAAAYAAAINKRDATAIAALFTPDGDEIFVDSPRIAWPCRNS